MGVGLLVTVWIARYLGPDQFGLLSYALAYVALFGAIAGLGLNDIIVRDLVQDKETVHTTLGSAFALQVLGSLVAFTLIVVSINLLRPDDNLARLAVCALSVSMLFKASEVVKYWFESQVQSKYSVWIENGVFCVLSLVRIALIYNKAPLMAFVWTAVVESALIAVGLLLIYTRYGGRLSDWRPEYFRAMALLKDSWPLILAGIAIIIYMRIDQIMIGHMLGDAAVGIYSAAVRISEVWYFIPMAIVASVFPTIIESKKQSDQLYYQQLQKLYDLLTILAVTVALLITYKADWLVMILFGTGYEQAAPVLTIYVWAGVFVALGVARGKWLVAENLQYMGYWYVGLAMIVNVIGNLILIPVYGAIGASLATVLAQVTTALIAPALFSSTRVSAIMLIRSLNPLRWLKFVYASSIRERG
jgi:O-antigen/teichoic acid export membrane protein